jgi:hypothetical protein
LKSWTAPFGVTPANTKQSTPMPSSADASERKFGALGSIPSFVATLRPSSSAELSMLRARPAPYTSLSCRIPALRQPSSAITLASAAPWIVSLGTMRR